MRMNTRMSAHLDIVLLAGSSNFHGQMSDHYHTGNASHHHKSILFGKYNHPDKLQAGKTFIFINPNKKIISIYYSSISVLHQFFKKNDKKKTFKYFRYVSLDFFLFVFTFCSLQQGRGSYPSNSLNKKVLLYSYTSKCISFMCFCASLPFITRIASSSAKQV